ncbi:MAG: XrtB/PEP-CTERM-associated transcriptional regulator EpsA [Rhodoferax sp.]
MARYYALISQVFEVRRHIDLMHWLQGDVQYYLPHDILVAAWGDFHLGLVHYDIVSSIPGVRSENAESEIITPLLTGLFDRWIAQDRRPFSLKVSERGFAWDTPGPIGDAMGSMRSSLIHGINDQRGRHDCLYVLFSAKTQRHRNERTSLKFILPYIDNALRQVELLPRQYVADNAAPAEAPDTNPENEVTVLSEREAGIMKWVAMGKTNGEIGSILDVSTFTVKNHMQRIFKKLDVFNRAQAVSAFSNSKQDA